LLQQCLSSSPFPTSCQRGNQQHEYDKKITKGYGIVFNLHAIEGYSHKEIGALINKKKVQTVLFGLCGD